MLGVLYLPGWTPIARRLNPWLGFLRKPFRFAQVCDPGLLLFLKLGSDFCYRVWPAVMITAANVYRWLDLCQTLGEEGLVDRLIQPSSPLQAGVG